MTVRKLTVSDLIRESKSDWKPVKTIEQRDSTRSFTGCPQIDMQVRGIHDAAGRLIGGTIDMENAIGFQEQMDDFNERNNARAFSTFYEEETHTIADLTHASPGSKLPR